METYSGGIDNKKLENEKIQEDINYTKWIIKQILEYSNKNMNNDIAEQIKKILLELYDISHRNQVNSEICLSTRRKKAWIFNFLIEEAFKNWKISKKDYDFFNEKMKIILLENFSQIILPETSGILKPQHYKTEQYLNTQKLLDHKVLEPREYIWIVPEAHNDLEAPSFVTATTPAFYEQPWHHHNDNWEVTFYAWPSKWKFKFEDKIYEIEANFWDFIIFPPKTFHTIENPTDKPVKNMSVKVPWALLDRGREYSFDWWKWFLQKMQDLWNWVKEARFENQWVPYFARLFCFDDTIKNHKIKPKNKALLYVLDGGFLVEGIWKDSEIVLESFSILLDKDKQIEIKSIKNKWNIYMIEFLDNWQDFAKNNENF